MKIKLYLKQIAMLLLLKVYYLILKVFLIIKVHQDILTTDLEFLKTIGLDQHLSVTRKKWVIFNDR